MFIIWRRSLVENILRGHPECQSIQVKGQIGDAEGLQQLLLDLGFIVECYDNPKRSKIKEALHVATYEDYSKLGCFACVLFSHG